MICGDGVGDVVNPRVSVCVPALNAERTIAATLESILAQDFDDFEIVVIDNNSSDGTRSIVNSIKDSRIRLYHNETTLPMAENWNTAVRHARGELFKLVCADDLIAPQCLSIQVDTMGDDGIAATSSLFDVVDDDGAVIARQLGAHELQGYRTSEQAVRTLVRKLPDEVGPTGAFMFRTADIAKTAGFRANFMYALDIDLWVRLCARGAFYGQSVSLASNRASSYNVSSRTSTVSKFVDIIRFNHAMGQELSDRIRLLDVATGDLRVARAAVRRLGIKTADIARGHRRMPISAK
ncbi:glycosyltransferase family 2 protein [Mycolicibacterium komossense]|uniref:glycosyltransferase family 2 protein n=1 Tax=Mycolicibacterium komossense TaxID=1779 RepID=UPI0027E3A2A9|nr:glycosyltransferase family 2 protein [Mycolicibacterium komossense]